MLSFFSYDAIKAKEVTVPIDETGRAMLDNNADPSETDDGWLTSRVAGSAQAPRKCHQLSVLHRMVWHRLIMIDVLGRKGFLIKPGTARAQAAVAINSVSRYDFTIVCYVFLQYSFHLLPMMYIALFHIGSFYLKKKQKTLVNQQKNSRMIGVSSDPWPMLFNSLHLSSWISL